MPFFDWILRSRSEQWYQAQLDSLIDKYNIVAEEFNAIEVNMDKLTITKQIKKMRAREQSIVEILRYIAGLRSKFPQLVLEIMEYSDLQRRHDKLQSKLWELYSRIQGLAHTMEKHEYRLTQKYQNTFGAR